MNDASVVLRTTPPMVSPESFVLPSNAAAASLTGVPTGALSPLTTTSRVALLNDAMMTTSIGALSGLCSVTVSDQVPGLGFVKFAVYATPIVDPSERSAMSL
ncbi:MAG TPA: hypothetical protein VFN10_20530 [Thermoanaerobaculia bacterium]|nr:hypothetical protein [Thermoanaerobaculia bacterium]